MADPTPVVAHREPLRYGSLFSGVGLLDLGVEMAARDAGVALECAFQVEIDPFCRAVLTKHWPEVPKFDDVREQHRYPAVDVLVGGFPCQDVSLAGKGAGVRDGARSGLWREYLRIVHELRPRAVLVENVPGLVRRGLDDVVAGLADAGYAVEGTRLRAEDLGAPHRRDRLFLVAHAQRVQLRVEQGRGGGLLDGERSAHRHDADGRDGARAAEGEGRGAQPGVGRVPDGGATWLDATRWPAPPGEQHEWEPPRVAAGVVDRRHRLTALGNGVVPQCAYVAARRLFDRIGWAA